MGYTVSTKAGNKANIHRQFNREIKKLTSTTGITCIVIYKYLASVGINLISDFLSQN